jgi:dihydrofolate reductase
MSTLFPLPPEPAQNNQELLFLIKKYSNLDVAYLNVHMRPDWHAVKIFFDAIWSKYKPFADTNFITEFQVHFTNRAWEVYLFDLLKKGSFNIIAQSKKDPNPDFKISIGDRNLFIEAVSAGKGEGPNAVETISDMLAGVPSGTIVSRNRSFDEANHPKVRRITSVLMDKLSNYFSKHKTIVGGRDYYVIALNAGDIDGDRASSPEALILEALGGISPAVHLPIKSDGTLGPAFHTTRESILNSQRTNSIDVNLFSRDDFKEISGIIYFGRDVINAVLQSASAKEVIFVHNPNVFPDKKIPLEVFSQFTQITFSPIGYEHHPPFASNL